MQPNRFLPPRRPRFSIPPRIVLVAAALGATLACGQMPAVRAQDAPPNNVQPAGGANNSYRLFYEKLADQGDWFQTDDYGFVFQPRVAVDDKAWRPYTDGYWAQTNAGWTWVSNEPFGWACYHYGRWANLVDTGWVWVPGPDWSPGYVSWRISKDHKHVGWAPLPPEATLTSSQAVEGWADTAYDIGPDAYTFINTTDFGDTNYRTHVLPYDQNVSFITETENVTRLNYRNVDSHSVIYDGGPDVAIIRESSGRPVRELRLETRSENAEYFERGDHGRFAEVNGDRFVVATAAADVITSSAFRVSEPARVSRRLDNVRVDRGYQGIRDPQQAERIRQSFRSQSPQPPAQVERAASAMIQRTRSNNAAGERNNANNGGLPGERNNANNGGMPGERTNANNPPGATGLPGERNNAAGASMERNGQPGQPGRNAAAPNGPRNGVTPAPASEAPAANATSATNATPAAGQPTPGGRRHQHNQPQPTPGAPTEAAPGRPAAGETPAAAPGATPAAGHNGRRHQGANPGATPASTPAEGANAAEPGAAPHNNGANRENAARERNGAPAPSATPHANAEATPAAEHGRHNGNPANAEATPAAARSHENATPASSAPRHEANPPTERPASKQEATPQASGANAERRHGNQGEGAAASRPAEQGNARSEAEHRPASAGNAEAAAPRHEAERPAAGNTNHERAGKPETGGTGTEKPKPSP